MVIVTGSKQSGTALWMHILVAAGLPPFGGAVGSDVSARPLDPGAPGAFEASLRHGIYFATNPSPVTARYVFAEQLTHHVAELFPFGVTRTERAYIGKVVATLRPIREYVAAMRRLHSLEDAGAPGPARARVDPALEWWAESYAVLRDATIRQYPLHLVTQDHLLRDPERVIAAAIGWLGEGDAARAADTVKPEHRSFEAAEDGSVGSEIAGACDELYDTVDHGRAISPALLSKLNETQRLVMPRLLAEDARVSAADRTGPLR